MLPELSAAGRGTAAVVATAAAVPIAAAGEDQDQNNDPPAIPAAEETVDVTAHMRTSYRDR